MSTVPSDIDCSKRTVSRTIGKQNKSEIRVYNNISVFLSNRADSASIGKRHLALTSEATENGHNMFWCLVCFVDDDDATEYNRAKKGRVGIPDDSIIEGGGKHQLVDGGITVKLNVFSRTT